MFSFFPSLQDNCQNNIKILLFDINGNIFTCGTFAQKTRCWRFQVIHYLKCIFYVELYIMCCVKKGAAPIVAVMLTVI